jgi:hypothetical protein
LSLPVALRFATAGLLVAALLVPQVGGHSLLASAAAPPVSGTPAGFLTVTPVGQTPPGGFASAAALVPTLPASMPVDPSGLLPRLPWEAPGALEVSLSGTPWKSLQVGGLPAVADDGPTDCADQGDPAAGTALGKSRLCFWCPGLDSAPSVNDGTNTLTMRATCPYRIVDDADLLGSPQIAVNANDPNAVAFFSLHGGGSTEGPTPRSRDPSPDGMAAVTGLSHTTFTSQDMGRSWHDNPWGTDGFGEHIAGTMDADGNLYIGALWSKRLGEGRFDYVIKLYKEQDGRYTISTYQPSKTYSNRASGNTIDEVSVVYVPEFHPPTPLNATDNQTSNNTAPADDSQVGNGTQPGDDFGARNAAGDRVMAVWYEQALDWRNSTTGKSSWIDAAWTDTSARDNWTRLADSELIGPCMAASNAVVYGGKAYVACVADAGYSARSRARIGDIDVWSIDPTTGKTRLEERTPLVGGDPHMTSRPDGFMAISSTKVRSESEVDVQVSFGWYGGRWDGVQNVGGDLHTMSGGHPVREARVTAMALTGDTNTLFMTYMERTNVTVRAPDPNPTALNTGVGQAIEYHKLVTTLSPCGFGLVDVYDLQLGVARHPFAQGTLGPSTGVFDDLQDGMAHWKDEATGQERVYFAYGDHGVIQFGALEGESGGLPCPLIAPAPTLPPPPIPAALSTASPYSMLVGSTVGATALAMVTYLLAAKRKSAVFSASKDKRK